MLEGDSVKYCYYCNTENEDDNIYCEVCGAEVRDPHETDFYDTEEDHQTESYLAHGFLYCPNCRRYVKASKRFNWFWFFLTVGWYLLYYWLNQYADTCPHCNLRLI